MNIVFICTGNTCRSPMAQALALAELRRDPTRFADVAIASAGLFAAAGAPASTGAQTVAQAHGLDLSDHRAQQLTAAHVDAADKLWTMTKDQAAYLAAQYPDAADRIEPFAAEDISDPYGGDTAAYEKAYQDIAAAFADRIGELEKGDNL